jgi:type VI secretion system protein ImpK
MTPRFAQAVDPIFLQVLGLLDRLSRGESPSPQDERLRIRAIIDQAEATLGSGTEWELAKYAIVAWIDELLIDASWPGQDWWSNNVLEMEYFKSRSRFEKFWVRAQEATTLERRDALEVYYICVVLGFRGLYRDPNASDYLLRDYGLPPDVDSWARQATMSIRLGQRRAALPSPHGEISGAPPLRMKTAMLWSWWLAAMLALVNIVVFALSWNR